MRHTAARCTRCSSSSPVQLALHNDSLAERAVTLGFAANGTVRHVASASKLPEYPANTSQDLFDHVKALAERIEVYLQGVRLSRTLAQEKSDDETVDFLTGVITEFEKNAWFLRATIAQPVRLEERAGLDREVVDDAGAVVVPAKKIAPTEVSPAPYSKTSSCDAGRLVANATTLSLLSSTRDRPSATDR